MSYLFIAHDLSVVRHLSDRVFVMYLGSVVESGTDTEVYEQPAHPGCRFSYALLQGSGHLRRRAARAGRPRSGPFLACPFAESREIVHTDS